MSILARIVLGLIAALLIAAPDYGCKGTDAIGRGAPLAPSRQALFLPKS